MLQSVLDEQKNASKNVLRIIETIGKHNNTPRKKPKFINFVKNVCGAKTNPKDIDAAWDLISVKLSALTNTKQQNKNQNNEEKEKSESKEINSEINGTKNDVVANPSQETTDNHKETTVNGEHKEEIKLSKKQKKEEKKRRKYEAELLSAETPSTEVETSIEKVETKKKGKKGKNKENINDEDANEAKNKKKRKRQDTIPTIEVVENGVVSKESKKKLKTDEEEEESICLHDQNVAKSEEVEDKKSKFNWHDVIVSVLKKKDNEMQFKRLQKRVLGEYSEFFECEVDDRIADKFIKKLKSAPNVRVDKNRVMLIEE